MPCGCKKGHGIRFTGAGLKRRKRGGMAISGAGYKKRKPRRRKRKRAKRAGGIVQALFNPVSAAARLIVGARRLRGLRAGAKRGSGGRILSGAVWHGYGSGMNLHGAGVRGKRVLPRRGRGKRLI